MINLLPQQRYSYWQHDRSRARESVASSMPIANPTLNSAALAVKAIRGLGWLNPFYEKETVIDNSVAVNVREWSGKIWLLSIRSFEEQKGHGTAAMKKIIEIADWYSVDIILNVIPYGNKKVPKKVLMDWYRSLGFIPYNDMMIKRPGFSK